MIETITNAAAGALSFASRWWKLALGITAAVSLAFIIGQWAGKRAERSAWVARQATAALQAEERARDADAQRQAELGGALNSITTARQELDNATRNLPDESPSARRRARFCAELRAQASRDHTAAPAC